MSTEQPTGIEPDPILDPADIPLAVSVRAPAPPLTDPSPPDPMAAAFNEWERRFIETPEAFEREFQTVLDFMAAESNGETPSYGAACSAYLQKLMGEVAISAESSDLAERGGQL